MPRVPPSTRPAWWPHFNSTLRSTAVTARLGLVLGIAIGACFLTGLLSYFQYQAWEWLPPPASPVWGYRVTQGVHVATGMAAIPLVLVKLWSVYPNNFRWPPFRSVKRVVERITLALLVSATLVQLFTGFFNVLYWYPFRWDFVSVHYRLAYVGHQHQQVQASSRVLGDDVLDLADGAVVDGLLRRHRQDRVIALVVGDRLRELGLAADGDVGDRVEAEGGFAALGCL